jgi:hypothetical protein
MACRTGCVTKDHESYAACARSANVQATPMWTNSRTIHSELAQYADARKQGVQPVGTKPHQVEAAMRVSEAMGKPFDAGVS